MTTFTITIAVDEEKLKKRTTEAGGNPDEMSIIAQVEQEFGWLENSGIYFGHVLSESK